MILAQRGRNRLLRLAAWRWRQRGDISSHRAIVIGGCPRSGSTLLRRLLDAHPAVACGPESDLLLPAPPAFSRLEADYGIPTEALRRWLRESGSQTRFVETVLHAYLEQQVKTRWADKTPLNVSHIDWIFRHFPEARFVHIIRDGRDAAASLRNHPVRRLVDGRWIRVPRTRPIHVCIRAWDDLTRRGLRHRPDPRYHEVRYESLVLEPEATLRGLFAFLREPWDPRVLDRVDPPAFVGGELDSAAAISDSRIGRWRQDLTPAEQTLFKRLANPLLVELGYESGEGW